jgi:CRP/FNR family cyclic AMP-dependent transcriptional regulator
MADSKQDALAGVDLFGQLSKRQLTKLTHAADLVSNDAGKVLIREGGRSREFIVFVEGAAEVRRNDQVIATIGRGDSIGEMSLLDRLPASATVVTTEPCELVIIDGRRFDDLLTNLPDLAVNLLATLAARLRETDKAFDTL